MAVSIIPNYVQESANYLHYFVVGKNSSLTIKKYTQAIYVVVNRSNTADNYAVYRCAGSNTLRILGTDDSNVSVVTSESPSAVTITNNLSYGISLLVLGTIDRT